MAYGDRRQFWIGWTVALVGALALLAAIAATPTAAERLGGALLTPETSSKVV